MAGLLTEQQQAAVEAEGDVLVMAGAGTGKTHTLVERVLHFALHPESPVGLDRFLIVTFTEAATAELQRRLRDALQRRHDEAPANPWIAAQLAQLDSAAIGTLHGYCLRLLREHFHELGLDPALRTLDESESALLRAQAMQAISEPIYAGTDAFSEAVRDLWNGQFQGQVRAAEVALRRLHGGVRALEDPAEWWRRQEAYWALPQPDAWLSALLRELPPWAAAWRERLELCTAKSTDLKNPNLARRLPWLDQLAGMTSTPEVRAAAALALGWLQEQVDEEWPRGKKGILREPLEDLFGEAAALEAWLRVETTGADPLMEDWGWCRQRMRTVLAWWRHFDAEYARRKREQSAVDFADQEQFALDLLGRGPEVGRTRVAAGERDRFAVVLVDECQDLNAAQDAILRAVARESSGPGDPEAGAPRTGNRFLVGDVKQSIYRFRFADPLIFQRYARDWAAWATDLDGAGPGKGSGAVAGASSGRVLTLNENFRSAARVLEFVNGLFPWLLRPEMGGVGFGPDAALQFGEPESRAVLGGGEPRVEIHVRATRVSSAGAASGGEGDSADDEPPADKKEAEATLIVARFRELHSQKVPVWDKKRREWRPVTWNDMVVLLRSKQSQAETFVRVFARAGVPLQASAGGFFSRREVRDLRNLVALFDNPRQDVPLLGVLRSAFAGRMTVDDLAILRLVRRSSEGPPEAWWTLLQHFVESGRTRIELPVSENPAPLTDADGVATISGAEIFVHPKLAAVARSVWQRANAFLSGFAEWRRRAARGPLSLALEAALDDTDFEAACRAQPEGPAASGNVLRFLELARQFEQQQAGGAAAFLEWLAAQEEAETIAPVVAGGLEAVTLLTIHKSKGLEFPVVAVASLGGQFNERDWRDGEWILDADRCLAPRVHPPAGRPYPSPTLWLAQRQLRREQWGEEARLLYVAFTRAADYLLLYGTASVSRMEKWNTVVSTNHTAGPPLSVDELESARAPLDWLGPALRRWAGVEWTPGAEGSTPCFRWRVWPETDLPTIEVSMVDDVPASGPRALLPLHLAPYAHRAATHEPAKATVTGLRKRHSKDADEEAARFTIQRLETSAWPLRVPDDDELRGDASAPADVTAVERGLLHHRFLEYVVLEQTHSAGALVAEADRLVREGRFTAAEASALDVPALVRFWHGALGGEIRCRPQDVRRELPFTLRLTMGDLRQLGFHPDPGLQESEFVVVQGVIDLVCLGADSAWLLDYKTDRVPSASGVSSKAAAYAPQLALYALAVERLFGRRVTSSWLHFLSTGDEVDVRSLATPAS